MTAEPITTNELIIKVNTMDDTVVKNLSSANYSFVIGRNNGGNLSGAGQTCIGIDTAAVGSNIVVIGRQSTSKKSGASASGTVCIGARSNVEGNGAIHLGAFGTNTEAGTFTVSLSTSGVYGEQVQYKMLDMTGVIPGGRLAHQGAGAPTTATVGSVGQFYVDTTNKDAYICVDDASSTYTWKKITP